MGGQARGLDELAGVDKLFDALQRVLGAGQRLLAFGFQFEPRQDRRQRDGELGKGLAQIS